VGELPSQSGLGPVWHVSDLQQDQRDLLHRYDTNDRQLPCWITGTTLCAYPDDKWGWAVLSGIDIKAPWLGPVDHFGGYFNYGQGASAYAGGSNLNSPGLFGSGNQVALGVITDAVFLNGGQFELTTAWTAGWAMSISGWPTSRRLGTGPTRRSGTTTLSSTAACSAMALLA